MKNVLIFIGFIIVVGCQGPTSKTGTEIIEAKDSISFALRWEVLADEDGILNKHIEKPSSVEKAEFSPDETKIVTVAKGDNSIRLYDANTQEEIWMIYADEETEAATFTHDGKHIITGGEDFKIRVIDATNGEVLRILQDIASIEGLQISNSGDLLATGNEAGQLKIWDISDDDITNWPAEPLHTLIQGPDMDRPGNTEEDVYSDINQVDWTADDKFVVTAGRNYLVKRWEVAKMDNPDDALVMTYEGHPGTVKAARLIPGDTLLASGSGQPSDGTAIVWEVETGNKLQTLTIENYFIVETTEFTPNGKFLLVGGTEKRDRGFGRFYVYRVADLRNENPKPLLVYPTFNQEYFYFSEDGNTMLLSGADGGLRVFDVTYH